MSSLTLPKSGGMRNGQLLQRQTLALPIYESVSSSLPTPTAMDSRWYAEPVKHRPNDISLLPRAIGHLLPTPLADKSTGYEQPHTTFRSLANQILSLLPTPTVNDMGAGKDPQKWQEWTEEMRQKHGNGNGHGRSLEQEAVSLLPTTTTHSSQHQQQDLEWGAVNDHTDLTQSLPVGDLQTQPNLLTTSPTSLVGDNTSQPFDAGNTSSDDQHQTPQLWEEQGDPG
jgi:DNA (cytosine-5)-methyltransferase 1